MTIEPNHNCFICDKYYEYSYLTGSYKGKDLDLCSKICWQRYKIYTTKILKPKGASKVTIMRNPVVIKFEKVEK